MKELKSIAAKQVYNLWSSEVECLKILDFRKKDEFELSRIPGSSHCSLQDYGKIIKNEDLDKLYVLILDEQVGELKSFSVMNKVIDNVFSLEEGFKAWLNQGFPVAPLKFEPLK